jgi:hypothetical protein
VLAEELGEDGAYPGLLEGGGGGGVPGAAGGLCSLPTVLLEGGAVPGVFGLPDPDGGLVVLPPCWAGNGWLARCV